MTDAEQGETAPPTRARWRPRPGAGVFDSALAGRTAVLEERAAVGEAVRMVQST